jgi:flagellar biosynthetic protein FlhB
MAADNKTEQPTPRRLQKAREKGQVARSRELSSALAIAAALLVISWQATGFASQWRDLMRNLLHVATASDLRPGSPVLVWCGTLMFSAAAPAMLAAFAVAMASSLAQGGLVFAPTLLTPNMERVSPAAKFRQLFSTTNLSGVLKSLLPAAVIVYITYDVLVRDWTALLFASSSSVPTIGQTLYTRMFEIAWKASLVMLLWSGFDYLLVRQKLQSDLRMSREEVREEIKESEGNPQIKGRIRRLQRQVRRRRMLQDVPRATVLVTNPTHFAVALRYTPDMAAPIVLAKGRNLFALEIRQAAVWHGIPVIENPPLAQALYRAVEVGQNIPAKLYTAVAEVLAFVYRAQQRAHAAREGR